MHKEIAEFINSKVPAAKATSEEREIGDTPVYIESSALHEVCTALKEDEKWDFKVLQVITGCDYPEAQTIEVSYILANFFKGHELILKIKLPRDNPKVMSVVDLWNAANFQERECFDMLGVEFENHPDHRRILCPDDWEGFPLRKDYVPAKMYKHMEVNPEDKMNNDERGYDAVSKEAFKDGGKLIDRPTVALKNTLRGQ
jgi:NADH-quinone oxidoreductase subunit C